VHRREYDGAAIGFDRVFYYSSYLFYIFGAAYRGAAEFEYFHFIFALLQMLNVSTGAQASLPAMPARRAKL
jgi:hypothetical protein